MNRSHRGILAAGWLLAVVVGIGVAWLVSHALAGASAAEADRHRAVAERLFDELEGELSAIVAREEARSFLAYRFYYVPQDNAGGAGLVLSELSKPPDDPTILGWFQLDPGNVVSTPRLPRSTELSLARGTGWSPDPDAYAVAEELQAVVGDASWSTPVRPPDKLVDLVPDDTLAVTQAPSPVPNLLLNRGSAKRADRKVQTVATKGVNLSSYNPETDEPIDRLVGQDANAGPDVNVELTPFSGSRRGDRLVLQRQVRGAGFDGRQGVVLKIPELEQRLAATVIAGSDLQDHLSLAWDGAPLDDRGYRYVHRFGEPFSSLSVAATLDRVPALVGREALTVRLLAAALLVAIGGGGFGLYRAVASQLAYARRRSEFVAAVSHELKTPLTTIRMYAEMLRDGMVPTADRQRAYHHTITMEADRLGRLIANVLELARLERGRARPELVVGQLGPILDEAVEIVRPHATAAGFTVTVVAGSDLPPVRVDRDAVIQIVVNLIDNAVKFAAGADRRIDLTLVAEHGRVVLRVRDHGPGVPRSHLRRVFEPFWRGERELTRRTRGTGIGLALVQGLATRMGGRVWARNHPEGGFEVAVAL
ncbi:MAG: HAMP domain-containing sensor histidine kinase [Myxococcota bacterium]